MKTKFFTLIVMAIGILASTSAFAANEQNVSPGQTATYSVTELTGATYEWHVYVSGSTTTEATAAYSTTLGSTYTNDIKWTAAAAGNTYDVWVQATDATGCLSEPHILTVTVSSPELCIATASTGTLNGVVTSAPTGTTDGLCSLITSTPATTGATTSGTAIGDETTFFATLTGGLASASYTVTYEVSSSAGTTDQVTATSTLSTDSSGVGALGITVSATDHPAHFYASDSENVVTIEVISVTVNSVTTTNTCTGNSYTVTVNQIPQISFQ